MNASSISQLAYAAASPQRENNRNGTMDPVSRRDASETTSRYSAHAEIQSAWNKVEPPGGRKLFYKIVVAFTVVAMFGVGFLVLSAYFVGPAYEFEKEEGMAMPFVMCIMGIVCGVMMIFGSAVLARLMVSKKWRKNQQPSYRRGQAFSSSPVRFSRNNRTEPEVDIHIPQDAPPPYEQPEIPPAYTTLPSTPVNQSGIILTPPTYEETVNHPPPKYEQIDPGLEPSINGLPNVEDVQNQGSASSEAESSPVNS